MSVTINDKEFELLSEFIENQCGIALDKGKAYLIENRLTQLLIEMGCTSFGELYETISKSADKQLIERIVDAMTTNETYWFRDGSPFQTFEEVIFPEYEEQLTSGKRKDVKIWSAACSTGQEPYSLAMIAHELKRQGKARRLVNHLNIMATDISKSALILGKSGRYNKISMSRGIEQDWVERYFDQQGNIAVLKPDLKKHVTFKQFNLQNAFTPLKGQDVILLRNVLIYFSREFKKEIYQKVAEALNPGGYFFIGSSELLLDCQDLFERRSHGRCVYYQVKK